MELKCITKCNWSLGYTYALGGSHRLTFQNVIWDRRTLLVWSKMLSLFGLSWRWGMLPW